MAIGVVCLSGLNAQLGSPPPRFSIPGAVPVPVRQPIPYNRNERLVGPGPIRIRRPLSAPGLSRPATLQSLQAQNNLIDEAKPVTEEHESGEAPLGFIPQQSISHPQQQQQQQQQQPQHQQQHHQQHHQQQPLPQTILFESPRTQLPAVLYSTDENGQLLDQPHQFSDFVQTTPRLVASPQPEHIAPTTIRSTNSVQRFGFNSDAGQTRAIQSNPKPVVRVRQEQREAKPQFELRQEVIQPTRRPQYESIQPKVKHHNYDEEREKKPVAQILRKYREENEDGTITWGFENDDGSYKEEIIGNDCVTRGRYGYIDPDGVKREYNYETGNQCDPNKRDLEEPEEDVEAPGGALQDNGAYVDYQENQMVLSNGQRVNLNGKHKQRRPIYQDN